MSDPSDRPAAPGWAGASQLAPPLCLAPSPAAPRGVRGAAREELPVMRGDPIRGRLDEAMWRDLHDGPGQSLVAIALLARGWSGHQAPGSVWSARLARLAEIACEAKRDLDLAARGLMLEPTNARGLREPLAALAESFRRDTGIWVLLESEGPVDGLAPSSSRAVYRVVHQALMNAWRHARCSAVRVGLCVYPDRTLLRIIDDGLGLGRRWDKAPSRLGIEGMRRAVEELGGAFAIRAVRPHGTLVLADLPGTRDGARRSGG